ncbi:MAG: single-stranded DNA-binding protein [Cellulosilyticaceae bacterium]
MNQVTLMGNLTSDLELKTAKESNIVYTQFTLAVNHNGNKDSETEFFDIVAFNQKAKVLSEHMSKGRKLLVVGSLKSSNYTSTDGQKRKSMQIILEDFEFAGYKKASAE